METNNKGQSKNKKTQKTNTKSKIEPKGLITEQEHKNKKHIQASEQSQKLEHKRKQTKTKT